MLGKFNEKSSLHSVEASSIGNNLYGAKRLSKTVKLLPHEESMFVKCQAPDGSTFVRRLSDVTVLLQAEKYANVYGTGYMNTIMTAASSVSDAQRQRDVAGDDALMASIVSRHIQAPSEVAALTEINIADSENLNDEVRSIVQFQRSVKNESESTNDTASQS